MNTLFKKIRRVQISETEYQNNDTKDQDRVTSNDLLAFQRPTPRSPTLALISIEILIRYHVKAVASEDFH